MDFNFNDIAGMLRAGVTPDEIAERFTTNLNNEMEAYNAECEEDLTPAEQIQEDYDFDEMSFTEICEILALAWNEAIATYLADNDIVFDGDDNLLMDTNEAKHFISRTVDIYSSSFIQNLLSTLPEFVNKVNSTARTASTKINNIKTTITKNKPNNLNDSDKGTKPNEFDEFDKMVADFLNGLHKH